MSFSLSTSTSLLRSRIEASDIQFNRVDLDNVNKYSIGYNLGDLIGTVSYTHLDVYKRQVPV